MHPRIPVLASLAFAAMSCAADDIPSPEELERTGAVIGEVFIDNQNIFDLEDPEENKQLYRLANKLHIRTQPKVIRQQLLFKSGDLYSQRLIDGEPAAYDSPVKMPGDAYEPRCAEHFILPGHPH